MGRYVLLHMIYMIFSASALDATSTPQTYHLLNRFNDAFTKIKEEGLHPLEDEVLMDAAIQGMMEAVDTHSGFLDPKTYRAFSNQIDGKYAGIGIVVRVEKGRPIVERVIPQGPAARAGMMGGDVLIAVNKSALQKLTADQIGNLLRGPKGTVVQLTYERGGSRKTVQLKRAPIEVESFFSKLLENGILYLRIPEFSQRDMASKIKNMLKKNPAPKGLIIDLRDNTGGILEEGILLANLFLDGKEIASFKSKHKERVYMASKGSLYPTIPIVILIDHYTASAAEVFAGALSLNKRAVLVGDTSYGKTSVQTVYPLDESAVRLTTGAYYLPHKTDINKVGLAPHYKVSTTTDLSRLKNDVYLPQDKCVLKAIELIRGRT